jgi:NAD(P)-dependent dehydrogenase (short-subunit alcohol dehydrogenase family)
VIRQRTREPHTTATTRPRHVSGVFRLASNEGRAVFLTGAGGGIGVPTARALSERGFSVFAGVRRESAELAGISGVRQVTLELTDPRAVREAAAAVAGQLAGARLHALVNNAGIMMQGPLELLPAADLERQFAVNVYGAVHAIQALLPLLRSGPGRLVNVSAPTARVAVPFAAPVSASKAALQSISDALRVELAPFGIQVVLVEPGTTRTPLWAKTEAAARAARHQADPEIDALYAARLARLDERQGRTKPRPAERVAKAVVRAVEARRPRIRYTVGDAKLAGVLARLPTRTRDRALAGALGVSGKGNKDKAMKAIKGAKEAKSPADGHVS